MLSHVRLSCCRTGAVAAFQSRPTVLPDCERVRFCGGLHPAWHCPLKGMVVLKLPEVNVISPVSYSESDDVGVYFT